MPSHYTAIVTRTDLIGDHEAEPMTVEWHDDGWVEITLDDGEMLQLDPRQASGLAMAFASRLAFKREAA